MSDTLRCFDRFEEQHINYTYERLTIVSRVTVAICHVFDVQAPHNAIRLMTAFIGIQRYSTVFNGIHRSVNVILLQLSVSLEITCEN